MWCIPLDPIDAWFRWAPRSVLLTWQLLGFVVPLGVVLSLGGAAGAILGAFVTLWCGTGLALWLAYAIPQRLRGQHHTHTERHGHAGGFVLRITRERRRTHDCPFEAHYASIPKGMHPADMRVFALPGLMVIPDTGYVTETELHAALRKVQHAAFLGPFWLTALTLDALWAAVSGHPGPLTADARSWRP